MIAESYIKSTILILPLSYAVVSITLLSVSLGGTTLEDSSGECLWLCVRYVRGLGIVQK